MVVETFSIQQNNRNGTIYIQLMRQHMLYCAYLKRYRQKTDFLVSRAINFAKFRYLELKRSLILLPYSKMTAIATFLYKLWSIIWPIVVSFQDIYIKLVFLVRCHANFFEFRLLRPHTIQKLPILAISYCLWGHSEGKSARYTFCLVTTDPREPGP